MFGRQVEDADPLDVELFHEVADGGEHDIDLGASRPRPSGRWWLVGGAIAAAILLVIVATTIGRDSNESALPPTTLVTSTSAATATSEPTPRTTAPSGRRATTTTISGLVEAAPVIPTDQPWSIFVMDQNNGQVLRIDVQTGEMEPAIANQPSFVSAPQGTFVVETQSDFFAGGAVLPAGPEYGTYWTMDFDNGDGTQVLVLAQQLPGAETAELVRVELSLDEYLLGSTATGEAVINGPDFGAYTVSPADGSRRRFATGRVQSVQNGFYTEITCDDVGACRSVLHGAAVVERPYEASEMAAFSPSGTWVALSPQNFRGEGQPVRLLNLLTGVELPVEGAFAPGYYGFGWPTPMMFTPDERWAIGVSAGDLVVVDLATGETTRSPVPRRASNLSPIVVL